MAARRGVTGVVAGMVATGLVWGVAGCGGGADEGGGGGAQGREASATASSRAPSGELVRWAGDVCAAAAEVKELRTQSAEELKKIRKPGESELSSRGRAIGYLAGMPSRVRSVESDLAGLGPSGVPAADRMLDAWRKKVKGVVSELDGVSPAVDLEQAPGSAADVDALVQGSLAPPEPDLPALAKKDARLAAAYERAEQCAPGWRPGREEASTASPETGTTTGPLPEAANGREYAACSDGSCEVLVTSTAAFTANGVDLHISVADDYVAFRTPGSLMQLGGVGGEAGFGDTLKAVVVGHDEDGAVLRFSKP